MTRRWWTWLFPRWWRLTLLRELERRMRRENDLYAARVPEYARAGFMLESEVLTLASLRDAADELGL